VGHHRARLGLRRLRLDAGHARRDGDGGYILNGSKTFITNGPYADTIVFICKLDEAQRPERPQGRELRARPGHPGLEQSKPLRKMGMHSSPTGELFLEDVRVGKTGSRRDRGGAPRRKSAKDTFAAERTGVAAMALGIIEQCLELSTEYAKTRVQFGKPIGEFQLIQLKLAKMEVARMNIQNLVFRQIELAAAGKRDGPGRGVGVQALQRPERDGGVPRGRAALRRQRLHGRVPGGAALPRRQGAPDLRRNRRDPDLADRALLLAG
jgi:alkylation response protein AidB-like acyl-CoA dehydrogenase